MQFEALLFAVRYTYLHKLEESISPAVGGGNLYQREGKVYLSEYPLMLNVTWFTYGILFPIIVMLSNIGLIVWEFNRALYPLWHTLIDVFFASILVYFFFLYRVQPMLANRRRK